MCSETSPPRLSFDLMPVQDQQQQRDTSLLDLNCDFEFNINTCFEQESSSADELFSHGVILPIQPREKVKVFPSQRTQNRATPPLVSSFPPLPLPENSKKEKHKETIVSSSDNIRHSEQSNNNRKSHQSKSFWGTFKRSSSLNCENKRSLLCSLPLLSRSNSTGSVPNQKRTATFKEANKNNYNSQKQPLISMARSSSTSSSSSSSSNPYTMLQKPPLKKNYGGSYGNGVRIIPVINVPPPPPYISKGTAKLFGLGSFLQHGKDKKSKK